MSPSTSALAVARGPALDAILLIEENCSVRDAATFVLECSGFTVTDVADGPKALAVPRVFDLELLDLMLRRERCDVVPLAERTASLRDARTAIAFVRRLGRDSLG